jgi:hypothetical protein
MPIEPFSAAKVDSKGETITINNVTGLVRVGGMPVFKIKAASSGEVYLQFYDCDKVRTAARGTRFIEIPVSVLVDKLLKAT